MELLLTNTAIQILCCLCILVIISFIILWSYLVNYIFLKNDKPKEYILCAANHYNDGEKYVHQPFNIDIGFVICGHRHHVCNEIFAKMVGFPYDKKAIELLRTEEQGFLTNKNRFVNRQDALTIARLADQVLDENEVRAIGLHSEDLY